MRTSLFLFFVCILFGTSNTIAREFDTKNIRSVFVPAKKISGTTEMIRLYRDKTFEHLIYTVDDEFQKAEGTRVANANYYRLERNTGTYKLENGELTLSAEDNQFSSSLYGKKLLVDNSKVYDNKLKALFKKDQFLLCTASKSLASQPFYLDPEQGRFVTNPEAEEWYDLDELTEFVSKDKLKPQEKIDAFWDYIRKSIVYDYKGYESGNFTNDQEDIAAIIAGQNRVAVCSGYSWMFKTFLNKVGVRAEYIAGLAKTSSGVMAPHAWNAVFGGKDLEMYDITWGDEWKKIDPSLMIFTHFPDNPDHQLIDNEISKEEFKKLAFTTPEKSDPYYVSFFPNNTKVEVNNNLKLEFKGSAGVISVNAIDLSSRSNELLKYTSQVSSNGSVFIDIPISSKESWVTISSSHGFEIQYHVINNGSEQKKNDETKLWNAKRQNELPPNYGERDLYVYKKETIDESNQKVITTSNTELEGTFKYDLFEFVKLSSAELDNSLIREAIKYYGIEEIPGTKHNKTIVGFFKSMGHKNIRTDEDAWCSVFLAACAKNAGLVYSSEALARSWLDVGMVVQDPRPGDIVIFWRESKSSYMGHVAIWLGETSEGVICLGGNQDDKVCIKALENDKVLGYRRLTKK